MLEWFWTLMAWMGSTQALEHKDRINEHRDLREERDSLREDLIAVMHAYQELNVDLKQQLDRLEAQVKRLEDDLRKEKKDHADCRIKLGKHENEIFSLKIQVRELMLERNQNARNADNSGR